MMNGRSGLTRVLTGIAGLLLVSCGSVAEGQEGAAGGAEKLPIDLPGVDLSPLSPEQRDVAMKIFQENNCNCGCGMNIVDCRTKDSTCGRSPQLAARVISLLAQGKPADDVVKAVFSAPPAGAPTAPAAAPGQPGKEYVFPVSAGDSYSIGPESAPVTLITWLDYQ